MLARREQVVHCVSEGWRAGRLGRPFWGEIGLDGVLSRGLASRARPGQQPRCATSGCSRAPVPDNANKSTHPCARLRASETASETASVGTSGQTSRQRARQRAQPRCSLRCRRSTGPSCPLSSSRARPLAVPRPRLLVLLRPGCCGRCVWPLGCATRALCRGLVTGKVVRGAWHFPSRRATRGEPGVAPLARAPPCCPQRR